MFYPYDSANERKIPGEEGFLQINVPAIALKNVPPLNTNQPLLRFKNNVFVLRSYLPLYPNHFLVVIDPDAQRSQAADRRSLIRAFTTLEHLGSEAFLAMDIGTSVGMEEKPQYFQGGFIKEARVEQKPIGNVLIDAAMPGEPSLVELAGDEPMFLVRAPSKTSAARNAAMIFKYLELLDVPATLFMRAEAEDRSWSVVIQPRSRVESAGFSETMLGIIPQSADSTKKLTQEEVLNRLGSAAVTPQVFEMIKTGLLEYYDATTEEQRSDIIRLTKSKMETVKSEQARAELREVREVIEVGVLTDGRSVTLELSPTSSWGRTLVASNPEQVFFRTYHVKVAGIRDGSLTFKMDKNATVDSKEVLGYLKSDQDPLNESPATTSNLEVVNMLQQWLGASVVQLSETPAPAVQTPIETAMEEELAQIFERKSAEEMPSDLAPALGSIQAGNLGREIELIFSQARGIEDKLVENILNFSTDPVVMAELNRIRADQGSPAIVAADITTPKVQIYDGFDETTIRELAAKKFEGVDITIAGVAAKDWPRIEGVLRELGLNAELSEKSVVEVMDAKLRKYNLRRESVTQILGTVDDKKIYAQILTGSIGLGVVVAGKKEMIAGVGQVLSVYEVFSAAFEAARSIAKSA
jgi:hypothetical protein